MNLPAPPPSTAINNSGYFSPGERVAVLLALPLAGAYDYRVPEHLTLSAGDFVTVPLGKREVSGVIWGKAIGDVDSSKIKTLLSRHDCPPMPDVSRNFIDWVASYTLQSPGAVLKMAMSVPAALTPPAPLTALTLADNPPEIKMTETRNRVVKVLKDGPPRPMSELAREAATGTSVVRGLVVGGVLKTVSIYNESTLPLPDPEHIGPELSVEQTSAAEQLVERVQNSAFSVSLLDGVPGSGKTEVYFQTIAETLRRGQQVVILLPEIALSAQWMERFKRRFGCLPCEWHSDLTPANRRKNWRSVATNQAKVIVGARSALFLPFADLGLIIVDEEHDGAFKQEDGVIYHARDMAVVRARLGSFPIVLASATPSLETWTNVAEGKYKYLHLPSRHAGALLPETAIIDLIKDPPPRGSWISHPLRQALEETFANGEQALLFLNRRGYAPLTLCRTCGHRFQCPRCTAWLVEHRRTGRLQCHHCGFNTKLPEICPSCEKEDTLAACGPGVERLAEEVTKLFPDARTVIADSDSITGPKAASELVRRIENHEVDLIIGTQIVAKGYHFPLLTLVGVVDADLGLQGGDLRAAERTYQTLYQVSGRAGRAHLPGRVLLQSSMVEHPVMKALAAGERDHFLDVEGKARKDALMPPYGRLVALIISGIDEASVDDLARELGRKAPRDDKIYVMGPAPAPLSLLRGRHRRRFLLKFAKTGPIQKLVLQWLDQVNVPSKLRIQIDVDPCSFM